MNITFADRRVSPRHNCKLPLRVRVLKSAIPEERTESENLSARGIYSPTNSPLRVGTAIQVLLKMPEEITGEPTIEWLCSGHVVRIEPFDSPRGKLGVDPLWPRVWSSAFWMEIRWGFILTAWLSQRASDCKNSPCLWFLKGLPDPLYTPCSKTKSLDCTDRSRSVPKETYGGPPNKYKGVGRGYSN